MQTFSATFPLILLGLLVFTFLWLFPLWQVNHTPGVDKTKAEACIGLVNATRQTWAQVLAGVFFLVTAYFTARTVKATEDNVTAANKSVGVAIENAKTASDNLEVSKRGQITDRYTKAIDQLGAEDAKNHDSPRRIGGIYALERIAFDSPEYFEPVKEVLTAYMRVNASWMKTKRKASDPYPEDIHSILTVLSRLNYLHPEQSRLELTFADMAGATLDGAHLEKAYLYGAHLEGASLAGTHLESAVLQHANFGAGPNDTNLSACFLAGADLTGADLTHTNISQQQLDSAITDNATKVKSSLHITPKNTH